MRYGKQKFLTAGEVSALKRKQLWFNCFGIAVGLGIGIMGVLIFMFIVLIGVIR